MFTEWETILYNRISFLWDIIIAYRCCSKHGKNLRQSKTKLSRPISWTVSLAGCSWSSTITESLPPMTVTSVTTRLHHQPSSPRTRSAFRRRLRRSRRQHRLPPQKPQRQRLLPQQHRHRPEPTHRRRSSSTIAPLDKTTTTSRILLRLKLKLDRRRRWRLLPTKPSTSRRRRQSPFGRCWATVRPSFRRCRYLRHSARRRPQAAVEYTRLERRVQPTVGSRSIASSSSRQRSRSRRRKRWAI